MFHAFERLSDVIGPDHRQHGRVGPGQATRDGVGFERVGVPGFDPKAQTLQQDHRPGGEKPRHPHEGAREVVIHIPAVLARHTQGQSACQPAAALFPGIAPDARQSNGQDRLEFRQRKQLEHPVTDHQSRTQAAQGCPEVEPSALSRGVHDQAVRQPGRLIRRNSFHKGPQRRLVGPGHRPDVLRAPVPAGRVGPRRTEKCEQGAGGQQRLPAPKRVHREGELNGGQQQNTRPGQREEAGGIE